MKEGKKKPVRSRTTSFVLGEKTQQQILQLREWHVLDAKREGHSLIKVPSTGAILRAAVDTLWHHEYRRHQHRGKNPRGKDDDGQTQDQARRRR